MKRVGAFTTEEAPQMTKYTAYPPPSPFFPADTVLPCARDGTTFTPLTAASLAKTAIVFILIRLFTWQPPLAMLLGRLVLRLWPGFKGA